MTVVPQACLHPGCHSLAKRCGYCLFHQGPVIKANRAARFQTTSRKVRGYLLYNWFHRPLQPRYNPSPRPLTPREEHIKEAELQTLLHQRPPRTHIEYLHLCRWASQWARKGGKQDYYRFLYSRKLISQWRRKWLREASYDPSYLESGKWPLHLPYAARVPFTSAPKPFPSFPLPKRLVPLAYEARRLLKANYPK